MKFVKHLFYLVTLSSVAMVGCAEIPSETGVSLAQPITIMTSAEPRIGKVQFNARGGTVQEATVLDLGVKALSLLAHSDGGALRLEDFELGLGDISIEAAALPPYGLQLTNVAIGLEKSVLGDTHSSTPSALDLSIKVPVTLRADLVLGAGKTYPLGPVAMRPLAATVTLARNGAVFDLSIEASCAGACWDVPGVANFQDGKIQVELPATVTNN